MFHLSANNSFGRRLRLALLWCATCTTLFWGALALPLLGQTAEPQQLQFEFDETGAGVLTVTSPLGHGIPTITINGVEPPLTSISSRPKVQVLIVTDIAVEHQGNAPTNVTSIGSSLGVAFLNAAGLPTPPGAGLDYDLSLAFAGAQGADSQCRILIPWTGDETATITLVNDLINGRPADLAAELLQAQVPVENDLASSCLSQFQPDAQAKIMLFVGDGSYYNGPLQADVRTTAIGSSVAIYPVMIRSGTNIRNEDQLRGLATAEGYVLPALDTAGDMDRLMGQMFGAIRVVRSWQTQIPDAQPGQAYTVRAEFPNGPPIEDTYVIPAGESVAPTLVIAEPVYTFTLGSDDPFQLQFLLDAQGAEIINLTCSLRNADGLSMVGAIDPTTGLCTFTSAKMDSLPAGVYEAVVQANARTGQVPGDLADVIIQPRPITLLDRIREWLSASLSILVLLLLAALIFAWVDYRRFRQGKTSVTGVIKKSTSRILTGQQPAAVVPGGHAQLVRLIGSEELPSSLSLTDEITHIGRRSDTSTLVLDDPNIDNRQCTITRKQGGYKLKPISKEHPTFLGDQKDLVQAAHIEREYELKDGAHIGFGSLNIVYRFMVGQLREVAPASAGIVTPSQAPAAKSPPAAEPPSVLALLTLVESDGGAPAQIEVRKEAIQFGHATGDGNDVVLEQDVLSGVHCRLLRTPDGAWELKHVGGANPSYLAGYDARGDLMHRQELTAQSAPARLEPGAVFGIFDIAYYRIDYQLPAVGEAQAAAHGPSRSRIRPSRRGSGSNSGSGR